MSDQGELFPPVDDRNPWQRSELERRVDVELDGLLDPRTRRDIPALQAESVARTQEAIERVDRNAAEEWKKAADAAIKVLCEVRDTITADDVWWLLEDAGVKPPREPRALGARLQAAARKGQIVNTRRTVKSKRPVTHGSWVAEWAVVK